MNSSREHQRSAFVTLTAWVFIVLSSFATFIALLQNITLHFLLTPEQLQRAWEQDRHATPLAGWLFSHLELFFGLLLVLAALTLAAAIGLLLRHNWARLAFIGLLLAAIVWNVGSLVMQKMIAAGGPASGDFLQQTRAMMNVLDVFSLILALVLSLACGWIAFRLGTSAVKREFVRGRRTSET